MISVPELKKLKVFRESSPASLERLAANMVAKTFAAGESVLKEGELSGTLYLIASGTAAVEKKLDKEGGRSKIVAKLGEEEFFGEMSFLESQPHSATVVAETECKIFLLPRSILQDLISQDPKLALEPVLTLFSGVSARLRRTTRELVTVFEVARVVALATTVEELARQVVDRLRSDLGERASIAFYTWNVFNDEYARVAVEGPHVDVFPLVLDGRDPLSLPHGNVLLARIEMLQNREGLLGFHLPAPASFDAGERQMIDTVSAVLAPALATARGREEESARLRLQRGRESYL